jgi:3-oxoacyl-[acyl-carrier-protein] synthase III
VVVGTEVFSRILDWTDRGTCVLFGDGAGAVVLVAGEGQGDATDRGILSTHLHSDGRFGDILLVDGGAGSNGETGKLRMAGKEVFRHAVSKLASVVDEALVANGLVQADIRWLIPHQANLRILEATARKLELPREKLVVTVDHHGNTSAASVPLALDEYVRAGRIRRGHRLLLQGVGGGFTWGSSVVTL